MTGRSVAAGCTVAAEEEEARKEEDESETRLHLSLCLCHPSLFCVASLSFGSCDQCCAASDKEMKLNKSKRDKQLLVICWKGSEENSPLFAASGCLLANKVHQKAFICTNIHLTE